MLKMIDFTQVVGHEQVIAHLQTAINQEKISNGYILSGEKGTGKHLLTHIFVRALQCENRQDGNPCGICKSCLQAETGNHPDIHWVTHEKASIGVDDIREQVNHDIIIKPYSGPYKIYVIADADKMTEQAQNAILKTIEEPPSYAVIILLTTNINQMLPTILSRCVKLELRMINTDVIKTYLMENYKIPDYAAELSARFSQGNVGKAIRFASSNEFEKIKEDVVFALKYIDDMAIYEIMERIKKLSEHRLEIHDYLDLMLLWYRDVLMLKVTNDPNIILYKDEYKFIAKQASKKEYAGIEKVIKAIDKAKLRLKANVNFDTTMELMLLTLKEN